MGLIETHNIVLPLFIILCFATILWPIFFDLKRTIPKVGMFFHLCISIILGLCIINSFYLHGLSYDISLKIIYGFVISFSLSKIGACFICLLLVLWPASFFYSLGYLVSSKEGNERRYLFFLNFSFASGVSIALASNTITMFMIYEIITLGTIPLVAHHYSTHVNKALKKYMKYLFGASLLLWLPSIIYLYSICGSYEFSPKNSIIYTNESIFVFLLIFFGIAKTSIFPFHGWLPSAMAANYPTSAVLHGVLVVNVGIFCLSRFVFEVFGVEFISDLIKNHKWINYIPILGMIYSGTMAIIQETVKKILAWSTVSQLNFIILLIMSGTENAENLSIQAITWHSFNKITLFLVCGLIYSVTRATRIEEFINSYKNFKMEFLIFVFIGLNLISLPVLYFGNFKQILIDNFLDNQSYELLISLMVLSFFSLIYIGKIIIYMADKNDVVEEIIGKKSKLMVISTIYTTVLAVIFNVFSTEIFNLLG